ncbi:MAG: carboxypeptidase regulatory-like domain-containing protein [Woeseiaceae bacterium]
MKSIVMRLRYSGLLAASCAAVFMAAPTEVQAQETTAAIRGKVLDTSGSPLAGASIVVTDERTGVKRTFQTNGSGAFFATRLVVGGPYTVSVNAEREVVVPSISLGDIYNLTIDLGEQQAMEEIVVLGQSSPGIEVAAGPAATFDSFELERTVAFNRDIVDVYGVDPRLNLDNEDDGFAVNCVGKNPRFNSITLDGVSQNDRFGLNDNGYSTAVGQPFPFDSLSQIAVELAPFDVTYGGFSACNINAVTKSGSNEWSGNAFYEFTNQSLRGDALGGLDDDFSTPDFENTNRGFTLGGPIIKDRLFFFAAYQDQESARFLARGFDGSGNGEERPWLSEADYNRINSIATDVYNYDTGGQPGDGVQEFDTYLVRFDWNISDNHNAAVIYNYFDGVQDRDSDGDFNEFEFANHFYVKGSESETITVKLASNWTDAFSTELFYSTNEMNDSQVTVGDPFFGDHQIEVNGNTVYLGADDSRQANALNTESEFFKLVGQYLAGNHVLTFGFESEELTIFNQFVQHARGGEYDYFDDSDGNPAFCAALTAQGRFDDPACGITGIDKFELGRPSRIYYGSGGGTNDPADAAANFSNTLNSVYLQDEFFWDAQNMTIVAGIRYDWFDSDDRPNFNPTFSAANGIRNDANIDGVDILMPRVGVTWEYSDDLTIRGGVGLFSGGNPNVWISNAWSNDGLTNVQLQLRNFDGALSILDNTIPLTGTRPGFDVPQSLFDQVAAVTPTDANDSNLVLVDPNYEQPSEWKVSLGATYNTPWWGIQADVDWLYSRGNDPAFYIDLSQEITGTTTAGTPIYGYAAGRGEDNYLLTNSDENPESSTLSLVLRKEFDNGLDILFGYAYTDAEDVSPMTSSTAGSNFSNTALLDINNPQVGNSNYVTPHRFTLRALYSKQFFGELETRVALNAVAQEGQPTSFVMDTNSLEGNRSRRHLLYVPTGPNDPNVVFGAGFDQTAFNSFVSENGLGSGFVGRNTQNARWTNRLDLRIDQEIPTFVDGVSGVAFLKIYNFGNFLNKDWGKVYDASFFSADVVDASVNANGQFVYENFSSRQVTQLLTNRSLWEARMGVEIRF